MTLLRFENPALGEVFGRAEEDAADAAHPAVAAGAGETMTVQGTVEKAAILLSALVVTAAVAWRVCEVVPGAGWALTALGAVGGLVVAIATGAKPERAPLTAPLYAALEGLSLGALSFAVDAEAPGVVIQATVATFAVLAAVLLAYSLRLLRATTTFTRVVTTATVAIAVTYVLDLGLTMVGVDVPLLHSGTGVGALVSLAIIGVVALNLVLDFAFIEQAVEEGAERGLEWFGAFGLLVTLVWLYVEILLFILEHMGEED